MGLRRCTTVSPSYHVMIQGLRFVVCISSDLEPGRDNLVMKDNLIPSFLVHLWASGHCWHASIYYPYGGEQDKRGTRDCRCWNMKPERPSRSGSIRGGKWSFEVLGGDPPSGLNENGVMRRQTIGKSSRWGGFVWQRREVEIVTEAGSWYADSTETTGGESEVVFAVIAVRFRHPSLSV